MHRGGAHDSHGWIDGVASHADLLGRLSVFAQANLNPEWAR
jgi:hypothetical protein